MADEGLEHGFALSAGELEADRSHPVRDLDRGDPLLSERHLPPCPGGGRRGAAAQRRDDGHRLARVEIALPDGAAGMPPVIVPRKTILELPS